MYGLIVGEATPSCRVLLLLLLLLLLLQVIKDELGAPWYEIYADLTPEPIAAASLVSERCGGCLLIHICDAACFVCCFRYTGVVTFAHFACWVCQAPSLACED